MHRGRSQRTPAIASLLAMLAATHASADPIAAITDPSTAPVEPAGPAGRAPVGPPARELTAADVAGLPPSGYESGRTDDDDADSALRVAVRGALFVPKVAFDVALTPVRGALWVNERYRLVDLYWRVFFNDARTMGLYPTASFSTSLGGDVGARFVHRDLFGEREHVAFAASGGVRREKLAASARTGARLGDHVELAVDAEYERRPHDPFFGIGNGDLAAIPQAPIDPRMDALATETRYEHRLTRVAATAETRIADGVRAIATGALTDLQFARGDSGPPIDSVYDPAGLVGFGGLRHAYGELELRVDRRHPATPWEPRVDYAAGWLAAAFAGRVHRLDQGRDFSRYGCELQQFLRIASGPRLIAVRFHAEAVTGSRDEVPFAELPVLGGGSFLRGYAQDRFRDRIAALGSLQYQWDLSHLVDASLFIDAGRVFASSDELGLDHMRVGYGLAIGLHSERGFLVAGSIASSIDGGIFLNLNFNQVFDARQRWR